MINQQKQSIIRYFNRQRDAEARELERMDKGCRNADREHSYAMGQMQGIVETMELLGYKLERDDEDIAVDIVSIKEDAQ